MRNYILKLKDNFHESALEGEIEILEEFIINAMRVYRYRGATIPKILLDTLPLIQKARTAIDTGTWQEGQAPNLYAELDAFESEFGTIDHLALADAMLAVGVDVYREPPIP